MLVICPKLHMVEGRARHLAQAYVMPDPVSLTSHNTPPPSLISASLAHLSPHPFLPSFLSYLELVGFSTLQVHCPAHCPGTEEARLSQTVKWERRSMEGCSGAGAGAGQGLSHSPVLLCPSLWMRQKLIFQVYDQEKLLEHHLPSSKNGNSQLLSTYCLPGIMQCLLSPNHLKQH